MSSARKQLWNDPFNHHGSIIGHGFTIYDESSDATLCYLCVTAYCQKKLDSCSSLETTYISTRYKNWKDTSVRFNNHGESKCHKDAVLKAVTIPASCCDISQILSSQFAKEKLEEGNVFSNWCQV